MQKKLPITYRIFTLAIILSCLIFSFNPPNGLTGAPGDGTCNNCHFGGTQTGSIDIVGITDNPIIPNKTYNVAIRISLTSGASTRTGFQFVALDGHLVSSASVGTISNLGTNDVNIALPVELVDFNVEANRYAEVELNWSSASFPLRT